MYDKQSQISRPSRADRFGLVAVRGGAPPDAADLEIVNRSVCFFVLLFVNNETVDDDPSVSAFGLISCDSVSDAKNCFL